MDHLSQSRLHLEMRISLPHPCTKGKGKVPLGCHYGGAGHLCDQIFHALEPSFGTLPLSSALSQLHILYVAWLASTPQIISPLKLTDFWLFLYHRSYTKTYKGCLFPQWLSQVVMTGAQTGSPRWESQPSSPAAAPTYLHPCTS